MEKIINTKSILDNRDDLSRLIDYHLDPLKKDQRKNRKKILEICHAGKFLMLVDQGLKISEVSEKPDFIITDGQNLIGLEHQIIVDPKEKEKEGFYRNIFDQAELELKREKDLPNFLANCYLKPHLEFKISKKQEFIETVAKTIKKFVQTEILDENPIIESIFLMSHTGISISENFGAWWQKNLSLEALSNAIEKKEKLLATYKASCGNEQWLLLVIGSTGGSSFVIDNQTKYVIDSEFDRVYILEDFYNNLYRIK